MTARSAQRVQCRTSGVSKFTARRNAVMQTSRTASTATWSHLARISPNAVPASERDGIARKAAAHDKREAEVVAEVDELEPERVDVRSIAEGTAYAGAVKRTAPLLVLA